MGDDVWQVRARFQHKPSVYTEFLNIMRGFKVHEMDTQVCALVLRRMLILLHASRLTTQPSPPAHRAYKPYRNSVRPAPAHLCRTGVGFAWVVHTCCISCSVRFCVRAHAPANSSTQTVSSKISQLFGPDNQDLIQEFDNFLPGVCVKERRVKGRGRTEERTGSE